MRTLARYRGATIAAAVREPAPELCECFDDVMFLADGRMMFAGAREDILPYFASLGFKPRAAGSIAEFLQACLPLDLLLARSMHATLCIAILPGLSIYVVCSSLYKRRSWQHCRSLLLKPECAHIDQHPAHSLCWIAQPNPAASEPMQEVVSETEQLALHVDGCKVAQRCGGLVPPLALAAAFERSEAATQLRSALEAPLDTALGEDALLTARWGASRWQAVQALFWRERCADAPMRRCAIAFSACALFVRLACLLVSGGMCIHAVLCVAVNVGCPLRRQALCEQCHIQTVTNMPLCMHSKCRDFKQGVCRRLQKASASLLLIRWAALLIKVIVIALAFVDDRVPTNTSVAVRCPVSHV